LLRLQDPGGRPVGAGSKNDLTTDGSLEPPELTLGLHGMFRCMADTARFEECLTGRSYPVAMEGDYLALERAYRAGRKEPGAPLMASFDGGISYRSAMEGPSPRATVVARRLIGVFPGQTCERAILRGREKRYAGTDSCTRFNGAFRVEGEELRLEAPYPSEPGECAAGAPAAAVEAGPRWYAVMAAARRHAVAGQVMEWLDEEGRIIAIFEAVYLH
jgi:hypothetical protein